ncbi:MAG: hypothetical protein AB7H71_10520 [Alphaproteobacteria bacterium]
MLQSILVTGGDAGISAATPARTLAGRRVPPRDCANRAAPGDPIGRGWLILKGQHGT